MTAEVPTGANTEGNAGKRKLIMTVGGPTLHGLFTTLLQSSNGPVRDIPIGQVAMLRSALAATDSGITVKGSTRRGFELKIPDDVYVIPKPPVEDIHLPGDGPQAAVQESSVPQVIFRVGEEEGSQDVGKPHTPRTPPRWRLPTFDGDGVRTSRYPNR